MVTVDCSCSFGAADGSQAFHPPMLGSCKCPVGKKVFVQVDVWTGRRSLSEQT